MRINTRVFPCLKEGLFFTVLSQRVGKFNALK